MLGGVPGSGTLKAKNGGKEAEQVEPMYEYRAEEHERVKRDPVSGWSYGLLRGMVQFGEGVVCIRLLKAGYSK